MKYVLKITPRAFSDLQNGIDYYNDCQMGLGNRFPETIGKAFKKIQRSPLATSISHGQVRYRVVDKFPYVVLYTIEQDQIQVLRIFNTHREPNF